jgi:hypothetical protein
LTANSWGRGLLHEAAQVGVEGAELLGQVLVPPGEAVQGVLGHEQMGVRGRPGAPAAGDADELGKGGRVQLLA